MPHGPPRFSVGVNDAYWTTPLTTSAISDHRAEKVLPGRMNNTIWIGGYAITFDRISATPPGRRR